VSHDAWRADERLHAADMTPGPWPSDAALRRELVAVIVRDIDYRCAAGRRGLLIDLLRAAWPSWSAQDQ
jgi:hypothetical protein